MRMIEDFFLFHQKNCTLIGIYSYLIVFFLLDSLSGHHAILFASPTDLFLIKCEFKNFLLVIFVFQCELSS